MLELEATCGAIKYCKNIHRFFFHLPYDKAKFVNIFEKKIKTFICLSIIQVDLNRLLVAQIVLIFY